MISYYLEDVSFGLEIGPEGHYVPALSGHGTTPRTMDEEYDLMAKQVTETQVLLCLISLCKIVIG